MSVDKKLFPSWYTSASNEWAACEAMKKAVATSTAENFYQPAPAHGLPTMDKRCQRALSALTGIEESKCLLMFKPVDTIYDSEKNEGVLAIFEKKVAFGFSVTSETTRLALKDREDGKPTPPLHVNSIGFKLEQITKIPTDDDGYSEILPVVLYVIRGSPTGFKSVPIYSVSVDLFSDGKKAAVVQTIPK